MTLPSVPAPPASGSTDLLEREEFTRGPDEKVNWVASLPFLAFHVIALIGPFISGITVEAFVLFLVMVFGRLWFITAGYHRYFAHRSYRTSRAFQLLLALGGVSCVQKGPLWWAGHHRNHHRYSDTDLDVHSPKRGFWWSHIGWIMCDKYGDIPTERIRDFAKYRELRFIDRYNGVFTFLTGLACFLLAGWSGLFVGFFLSTVVLWHDTFLVNSLAHVMGRRRFATTDTSRNSVLIAVATMGEGWHNNHHHYQASARNGFFWWEIDITFYVLRVLSWMHIVHDLKVPSAEMLAGQREVTLPRPEPIVDRLD